MSSASDLIQSVRDRANSRCEYCGMHEALQGATFHLEHVIPLSRGGQTDLGNLAWACPSCNLHKSNRVLVPDPITSKSIALFNPREENWEAHFRWNGYSIEALSVVGRATIAALDLNHPRRLRVREAEVFGLYPPQHPDRS